MPARKLRLDHLFLHLGRAALSAAALVVVSATAGDTWAVLPAVTLFLAAFVLSHDLAHGALGLPARWNEAALAFAGTLMLTSGHGMRVGHLRHHARPLGADDFEGASVHGSFLSAVWRAPWLAFAVRRSAWQRASRRDRRWQGLEHAGSLTLVVAGLAASGPARVYALCSLALQVSAPVWAGRIPHTAPAWMRRAARAISVTGSPTAISLAFHDLHHERPSLPTLALARATGVRARFRRAPAAALLGALGLVACATAPTVVAPPAQQVAAAAKVVETEPAAPFEQYTWLEPGEAALVHLVIAPGGEVRLRSEGDDDAEAVVAILAHPLSDIVRREGGVDIHCDDPGHVRVALPEQRGDDLHLRIVSPDDLGLFTVRVSNPGTTRLHVRLRAWPDQRAVVALPL